MEREVLIFSKADAYAIVTDDFEGFEVETERQTSEGRWLSYHEVIVKRESDGKFFKSNYSRGLTEYQDTYPYDEDKPEFIEVFPEKKTIEIVVYN